MLCVIECANKECRDNLTAVVLKTIHDFKKANERLSINRVESQKLTLTVRSIPKLESQGICIPYVRIKCFDDERNIIAVFNTKYSQTATLTPAFHETFDLSYLTEGDKIRRIEVQLINHAKRQNMAITKFFVQRGGGKSGMFPPTFRGENDHGEYTLFRGMGKIEKCYPMKHPENSAKQIGTIDIRTIFESKKESALLNKKYLNLSESELRILWNEADMDCNGYLDGEELSHLLERFWTQCLLKRSKNLDWDTKRSIESRLGMEHKFSLQTVEEELIPTILRDLDKNNDGLVSEEDFVKKWNEVAAKHLARYMVQDEKCSVM